jgi:hypothetical protein
VYGAGVGKAGWPVMLCAPAPATCACAPTTVAATHAMINHEVFIGFVKKEKDCRLGKPSWYATSLQPGEHSRHSTTTRWPTIAGIPFSDSSASDDCGEIGFLLTGWLKIVKESFEAALINNNL